MSTFFAIDAQILGYKVDLTTYGSPRVGDDNFAN